MVISAVGYCVGAVSLTRKFHEYNSRKGCILVHFVY